MTYFCTIFRKIFRTIAFIKKNKTMSKKLNPLGLFFIFSLLFSLISLNSSLAQEADVAAGKKLFNANCAACHKLNKKAVGPALKGVSAKYDKDWLYSWIKNSSAMIKAGDAQAQLKCKAKKFPGH